MIFEGPGGAQAALAALDKAQAEAVGNPNITSTTYGPQTFVPAADAVTAYVPGGMAMAEVGGNISITFANAPAGMQVSEIETNNPNLSLGVKGDTGKNKTGSGGL